MKFFRSATAIIRGLQLCFSDSKIRRLAFWPWIVGTVCYILSVVSAWYAHSPLLSWLVGTPERWWDYIVYYGAWLLVSLFLLLCTMIVTVVLVLILTGVFQTAIATHVLRENGFPLPEEEDGVKGLVKEAGRSIAVESLKLLWLVPLGIIVFLFGIIPFFAPIAIVLASWLLAYQFIDVALDTLHFKAGQRLKFSLKHFVPVAIYGLTLSLLWAIPLVGIFLTPAAAAGAAWLLSDQVLAEEIKGRLSAVTNS